MTGPTTRASLIERLKDAADDDAWREFDLQYRELLLRYCTRRGLNHWDAEDVRQTVMVALSKAFRGGFVYRPELGRFRGYLRRAARNAVTAHGERGATRGTALEVEALLAVEGDEDEGRDEAFELEWREHHLRLAFAAISKRVQPQSLAIFERLLEGDEVPAVAARFETSPAAVQKVRQRVRELLREQIAAQIRAEDGLDESAAGFVSSENAAAPIEGS